MKGHGYPIDPLVRALPAPEGTGWVATRGSPRCLWGVWQTATADHAGARVTFQYRTCGNGEWLQIFTGELHTFVARSFSVTVGALPEDVTPTVVDATAATTPAPIVVAPVTTAATSSNHATALLAGAVLLGTGLVGYAVYHRTRKARS